MTKVAFRMNCTMSLCEVYGIVIWCCFDICLLYGVREGLYFGLLVGAWRSWKCIIHLRMRWVIHTHGRRRRESQGISDLLFRIDLMQSAAKLSARAEESRSHKHLYITDSAIHSQYS